MAKKMPRGMKKLYEGRILGCVLQTDDEKVATLLDRKLDHEGRRYLEPIAKAALVGIRELQGKAMPAATIRLIDGKVTVHSNKQNQEAASRSYDVVRLPTTTDSPGE